MRLVILGVIFYFVPNINCGPVKQEEIKKCLAVSNENKLTHDITDNKDRTKNPCYEASEEVLTEDATDVYGGNQLTPEQRTLDILEKVPVVPNYYPYTLTPVFNLPYTYHWNTPWKTNEYRIDNLLYPDLRSVAIGRYGDIQYPYAYPDTSATYNKYPPVSYLPPVIPKHSGKLKPLAKLSHPMPVIKRPARFARSKEEDEFLAELSQMAMKNILPTMPIPMMRSVHGTQSPVYNNGHQIAVFPNGKLGYALPILLSCSPTVMKGHVARPCHGPSNVQSSTGSQGYKKQVVLKDEKVKEVAENAHQHDNKAKLNKEVNKSANVPSKNLSPYRKLDINDKVSV